MKVFLLSVLGSAFVALVYGFVFAQRESTIREYLRTSAHGIPRWFYIRALLGAVRGDAVVADSRNLAVLICVVCFAASIAIWVLGSELSNKYDRTGVEIERIYERFSPKAPETEDQQRTQLDALKTAHDALSPQVTVVTRILRIAGILLYTLSFIGWIAWMPYVKLRTRFAHEVSRFSLRIQGLATPQELAELTERELKVRDPTTLRQYVELMRDVAQAKGIVQLTKTFELWTTAQS